MPTRQRKPDPRVTKRRVTMRNASIVPGMTGPNGEPVTAISEAVTYVDAARPGLLEAFVADAQTRWQSVEVSDEPDAGPGGYDGATFIPAGHRARNADGSKGDFVPFPHELAGTYYPASDCGPDCKHAPEGARVVYVPPQEG